MQINALPAHLLILSLCEAPTMPSTTQSPEVELKTIMQLAVLAN